LAFMLICSGYKSVSTTLSPRRYIRSKNNIFNVFLLNRETFQIREQSWTCISKQVDSLFSFTIALGGLVVSVLSIGPKVPSLKGGRERRVFKGNKICSTTSLGGDVKPSVPYR
jgi:hypothetical protein